MKTILSVGAMGAVAVAGLIVVPGCSPRVRVDPIRVEPIQITHDVNIRRVDERLDEFFEYQEQQAATTRAAAAATQAAATQPAAAGGATP